jgi:beta-lactamase regulating signal transducer with metallopeptidase domain
MSVDAILSALGSGVLLAWLVLPVLTAQARRSAQGSPPAYHRALVTAQGLALLAFGLPALRPALNGAWHVSLGGGSSTFSPARVSEWMAPLIGSSDAEWLGSPLSRALAALALLWLLVVSVAAARLVAAHRRLARLCRATTAAPDDIVERAGQVAARLGIHPARIRVSEAVALPFSAGFLAPLVVLPSRAREASAADLDFMLHHELAHIARGDTRTALAVSLANVAFALHPTARRLTREIAFAREASVDALVASATPLEYAHFLLRSLETCRANVGAPALAVSMADTALTRRIDMLVSRKSRRSSNITWISLGGSALVLVGLVSLAPASWGAPPAGFSPRLVASAPGEKNAQRLPPETIREVVRASYGAFKDCYERLGQPLPSTRATLRFTIGIEGRVTEGSVDAEIPKLGSCLDVAMRAMVFPAPKGGIVTVGYPLMFEPG